MSFNIASSGSGNQPITVTHLQLLLGEQTINGYELYPHFLVKIMNIAHGNAAIKQYLTTHRFYNPSTSRNERLNIVHDPNFFRLLNDTQKQSLLPIIEYNQIKTIASKTPAQITEIDIHLVEKSAAKFKDIEDYLKKNGFYRLYKNTPFPVAQLQAIISNAAFEAVLTRNNTELAQYQQYVSSSFVEDETSTGTCINITSQNIQTPSRTEQEQEGHWKLHIGIDMEKCNQKMIDETYNIILTTMQKYRIVELKVAAPFPDVNSMRGKEFSTYLRDQIIIAIGTDSNVMAFISEIELLLRANGIPARANRDDANKAIASSPYFSYRNERAKVLTVPPIQIHSRSIFAIASAIERQLPLNYKTSNIIVKYNNQAYFIEQGRVLRNHNGTPITKTFRELEKLDITLADGDYISAEGCEKLSKIFFGNTRVGYNPFNYTDNKFKLGQINSSKIAKHWVSWVHAENNAYLKIALADILDSMGHTGELVTVLNTFSLTEHALLKEILTLPQLNSGYSNLKTATKAAQLKALAMDLRGKGAGDGQALRDWVQHVCTGGDGVLKQELADTLDFMGRKGDLDMIFPVLSLSEHHYLKEMLLSAQFNYPAYDTLRRVARTAQLEALAADLRNKCAGEGQAFREWINQIGTSPDFIRKKDFLDTLNHMDHPALMDIFRHFTPRETSVLNGILANPVFVSSPEYVNLRNIANPPSLPNLRSSVTPGSRQPPPDSPTTSDSHKRQRKF
jgi:hypothetical protein